MSKKSKKTSKKSKKTSTSKKSKKTSTSKKSKKTSTSKKSTDKKDKKTSLKKSKKVKVIDESEYNEEDTNEEISTSLDLELKNKNLINEADDCIIEDLINDSQNNLDKIDNYLEGDERKTRPYLTKNEMVRVIGERTNALKKGAKPMISNHHQLSYEQIAVEELKANTIPYIIVRPINGKEEKWKINELKKNHLEHLLN